MNVIVFVAAIIAHIVLCYMCTKLYFSLVANTYQRAWGDVRKNCVAAILFLVFVIVEIPLAIFFPAWANAKLEVIGSDHGRAFTSAFIIFGCFVLLSTLWMAWRS